MIETLPSSAVDAGLIPGQESRSHMPHDQKKRKESRSNIVTNLTKTLKTVHTKKTLPKKKKKEEAGS